ncbi:MAG: hypothetical protein KF874_03855 [Rhizobiaceae bacterium]|nr:hypothetical protein [Rhizobiaceae bacterium]
MSKKHNRGNPGRKNIYEVFGRWKHNDALAHLGSLEAANIDLARARAIMLYSERSWVELCIAPAGSFIKLFAHEDEVTLGFA